MQGLGFNVDEESVIRVVQHPRRVAPGYRDRLVAETDLDEQHILRVVYEEDSEIVLVTLYPARRERYEG